MNNHNWIDYYQITKTITRPRKTLIKAIEIFDRENHCAITKSAIDLGCGSGTDTVELLKYDWSVLAVDAQAAAITSLLSSCPQTLQANLRTKIASFESLSFLPKSQLINASYSLPFLRPEHFYNFWNIIIEAIHPGGVFSGIFFGMNDSWNTRSHMTFLSGTVLNNLLDSFDIKFFEEQENDETDALGSVKHSHKYFIVAKKRQT